MEYSNNNKDLITNIDYAPIGERSVAKSFISNVFMLMFLALLIYIKLPGKKG